MTLFEHTLRDSTLDYLFFKDDSFIMFHLTCSLYNVLLMYLPLREEFITSPGIQVSCDYPM